jgi:RimJ/RimL family protein N-acetyltransferase
MSYFLQNDVIYLKKPSLEDDLTSYLKFINDSENLIWTDYIGNFPMNKEDLMDFITTNKNLFLFIFNWQNQHVGNIQLSSINFQHRNAMLGIILGREFKGKGYASNACKLLLKHVFDVLCLHRIHLSVIKENKTAIKLYENLGFVKEGIEKDVHNYKSKYFDGIRYNLIDHIYYNMHEKTL